jgi:mono/diheme cytochrome c family protein
MAVLHSVARGICSARLSIGEWGVWVVRRIWAIVSVLALAAAMALAAGCVESSEEAAQTPEGAETAVNTAVQTDADGNTVPAPGAETAPAPAPDEPAPPANGDDVGGDAAAGETFFVGSCQGCHLNGGQDPGGIGPQLAGQDLNADEVENIVVNGQGAMPGGLASGDDLDNVVAYVMGLQ